MEYRLGQVRERTGLTARQIRAWELRGIVRPRRGVGNQRAYDDRDLATLRRAAQMRKAGLSVAEIRLALDVLEGRRGGQDALGEARQVLSRGRQQLAIAEELLAVVAETRR